MPATPIRTSALALCFACSTLVHAQATKEAPFQPMVGQEGKDVVWVPTPQALVDKMLDMAKVTAQDYVMDLGSGDGRTVITAAKRGARATGIEYNPEMVKLSQANAKKEGVADRAEFKKADLFQTDLSKATVITMFLLPDINLKLRPKLLKLKPGTRVVSNTFTMGDWKPDQTGSPDNCDGSWCTALLWIIPAQVPDAEERRGHGGDPRPGRPGSDHPALLGLRERGPQHGQRVGDHQRAGHPLQRASDDQALDRPGHSAQRRSRGEGHQAGHEHPPAAEPVAQRAAHHHQRGQREDVAIDRPLQP